MLTKKGSIETKKKDWGGCALSRFVFLGSSRGKASNFDVKLLYQNDTE